jgi:hypothetical protein
MVELINAYTGTSMWVAENRLDEYLAAGHKPVAEVKIEKPADVVVEEKPKTARKTTKKR